MTGEVSAHAVPPPAHLLLELVNTHDVEQGTDAIAGPEALEAWLAGHGLGRAGARAEHVARARELREAIRDLLLANNGVPVDAAAARAVIERAGRRARLSLRYGSDGALALAPEADGVDAALGWIVAAVFSATAQGSWPRLKACRAHDCAWAFYDTARNQSRQWCSMQVCGNRAKVRAYRRRRGTVSGETRDRPRLADG